MKETLSQARDMAKENINSHQVLSTTETSIMEKCMERGILCLQIKANTGETSRIISTMAKEIKKLQMVRLM